MKSAIEKLFLGQLGNFEFIDRSEEEKRNLDEVTKIDKELSELIKDNQEAVEMFMKYRDAIQYSNGDEILYFYKEGFRNGYLLAFDVLNDSNN